MNPVFIAGWEEIMEGIIMPVAIAVFSTFVRVALWGWTNIASVAATMCASCFVGICTHWILTGLGWPPTLTAGIVSLMAIFSREMLLGLFSRRTLLVIRRRFYLEIMTRGRKGRHD